MRLKPASHGAREGADVKNFPQKSLEPPEEQWKTSEDHMREFFKLRSKLLSMGAK
jgi:hypothetical protein